MLCLICCIVFFISTHASDVRPMQTAEIRNNNSKNSSVLVIPLWYMFNSRMMNVEVMAESLVVNKGYNVTILLSNETTTKLKGTSYERVVVDIPRGTAHVDKLAYKDLNNPFNIYRIISEMQYTRCEILLRNKALLSKLKNNRFDLIIVDLNDHCSRIIVDYIDVPTIVYSNLGFMPDSYLFFPQIPSFVRSHFIVDTKIPKDMNFLERLKNHIAYVFLYGLGRLVNFEYDGLRTKYGYNQTLNVANSYDRAVIMATINFVFDEPQPIMPFIIPLPNLLREPQPLGDDWAQWMEQSKHGVIVVSFGTMHGTNSLNNASINLFNNVFGRLSYRFVWKLPNAPVNLSSNIRAVDWMPQNSILSHENTVAFITHSGISSTYEAINNSVPVLCFPAFFDQQRNAKYMVGRLGMGLVMDADSFTENELEFKLNQILNNNSYKLAAKKASNLLNDTPMSAKEIFFWWTDYVIRHNGASHLTDTPAKRLNIVQFTGLDVALASIVGFGVLVAVIVIFLKLTLKCFHKMRVQSKKQKSK